MRFFVLLLLLLTATLSSAHKNTENMIERSKTIVFIHGLFMNADSWAEWEKYFENKKYKCIIPEYPYHKGKPSDLRENIPSELGKLELQDIVKHYEDIILQLDEKPILIGHSMGGHIVQILVNKGLATKGICIDSAPPKGVFSFKWSFLKSNLPTINPFKGNKACLPSVKWFQYAFCNTMSLKETEDIYNTLVVPESRNIPRSGTKKQGRVDFKKKHVPLLFIAGEKDHIIPPSLNKKNAKAYKDLDSEVDLIEFEGRTHIICAQDGWEEVAAFILDWIDK